MKIRKKIAVIVSALVLTSASSPAAMILTFTEEGSTVVMRASGTLSTLGASFASDSILSVADSFSELTNESITVVNFPAGYGNEVLFGVDLLVDPVRDLHGLPHVVASSVLGTYGFKVSYDILFLYGPDILDDDQRDMALFSPDVVATFAFAGASFVTLGLDDHAKNTDIALWSASNAAGPDGTIYFRVESVPEPSGVSVLCLGLVGAVLRRRR